ncbi:2-C-methyl-D-erythritol 4-phosphate cytidylyltransferase [Listeria sp. PSOL-1]|uniref:2-C-methyl-D-erythritol 4-phosphate cytidylyltransferase n=1 Tax=Listeria sp. PSOL-1 TaxID=1844999 RepID=UPI0013D5902B|nr:2-C-methyl-D-erythritol 4-phosphate cytidylyltransferase [Listeria sp. PSOL-1]
MNYELIFLVAGQGKRMNAKKNKIWLNLLDKPVFAHALLPFLSDKRCTHIVIVCHEEEIEQAKQLIQKLDIQNKSILFIAGGTERQHSVANGLKHCGAESVVLVHDGARPFVSQQIIDRLLVGVTEQKAAICAVKVKDTIKRMADGVVKETINRDHLWQVQTPQAFELQILQKAHEKAVVDHFVGTDESSLVERLNLPIQIVEGSYYNIKLTTPEDIPIAKAIIESMEDVNDDQNRTGV